MKTYEKMATKDAAAVRAEAYNMIIDQMQDGMGWEHVGPIKGGVLFDRGDCYVKIAVSVVNSDKAEKYVEEYAEQQEINAQKAAERAKKEEEKARKAAERAEKKAQKEAEKAENTEE